MNFTMPAFSIGSLIAVVVLVLSVVLLVIDQPLDKNLILGMIGALAIARLT